MYLLNAKKRADKLVVEEEKEKRRRDRNKKRDARRQKKIEQANLHKDSWRNIRFNSNYMGSFQVGDTSFLDKEFVKNGMKTLAVHTVQGLACTLDISLGGFKVYDNTAKRAAMAHALNRIVYVSCDSSLSIVGVVAKNPGVKERYCHLFEFSRRRKAKYFHNCVKKAFRVVKEEGEKESDEDHDNF
eukprot:m.150190 g.150190  ORF g.150190 m.150190 type:complete len:186 (+) comp15022_c0_seq11:170-727(+)